MPLQILLPMVVIGIAGLVALVHLLGYSRPLILLNEAQARKQWLRHFPDDRISDVTLCQSRAAALIETDRGAGVLWCLGADTVARRLQGAVARQTASGLTISLPDFAAPRVPLHMGKPEATRWAARIEKEAA